MKILIAGDWHSELHEEPAARALETLGHTVKRFSWCEYFRVKSNSWHIRVYHLWLRAQNKYLFGGALKRLNRDLIAKAVSFQPDAVFIYRGTHIFPHTLRELRKKIPGVVLIGYNNDDPFAKGHVKGFWRHFIGGLPELDLALAYRHGNLQDFSMAGARQVKLLRSWYISERNYPVTLSEKELQQYGCDVVFIGHYEPDMRLPCLEAIVRTGYQVRLYGPIGWESALENHPVLSNLLPVRPVWGEEYNRALCGAKVALAFLSKLNRDTYTRRSFEIPASGTLMLSEYTDDLASLFLPEVEADYFKSPEELTEKLNVYLHNDALRKKIAAAGHRRVREDQHDVISRMKLVTQWIGQVEENNAKNSK